MNDFLAECTSFTEKKVGETDFFFKSFDPQKNLNGTYT